MTLERFFKPIVIFFRLTSFLTIFQMIMNKILQNLINTREVVSFIDDGMEEEEEHNEVVEEVIKKLAENNLYMKLEKYKWKVREIEFLGVVIGPDKIKMKKEKMKEEGVESNKINNNNNKEGMDSKASRSSSRKA